jgi:hypothetical protein
VTVVWLAFREPEGFIRRWHNFGQPYPPRVFVLLAGLALLGTAAYGLLLGLPEGPSRALECCGLFTALTALSWAAPLPALYIFNSLAGSRLRVSTTFLAALVTASWGGLGFLALLPISAIFFLTFSNRWVLLANHLVVFAVVGLCMAVLYSRLQLSLEPHRSSGRNWWLWLFVLLQTELLYASRVLQFAAGS